MKRNKPTSEWAWINQKRMFFAAAIQKRACETHAAVDRLSYDQQPNAFIKTVSSEGGVQL